MEKNYVPVVLEMKSRLSENIGKSSYKHERFVITKRNKPVAALVNVDDLERIEQSEERNGLAAIIGKWTGFEVIEEILNDLDGIRQQGGEFRDVSI